MDDKEEQLKTTQSKFLGAWCLELCRTEVSDESSNSVDIIHPYGKDAKGILMYSADGHVSVQIMNPDAPASVNTGSVTGTSGETAIAVTHYLGYSGTFRIVAKDEGFHLFHRLECCSYPAWVGTEQKRYFSLEGDVLTLWGDPLPYQVGTCG